MKLLPFPKGAVISSLAVAVGAPWACAGKDDSGGGHDSFEPPLCCPDTADTASIDDTGNGGDSGQDSGGDTGDSGASDSGDSGGSDSGDSGGSDSGDSGGSDSGDSGGRDSADTGGHDSGGDTAIPPMPPPDTGHLPPMPPPDPS